MKQQQAIWCGRPCMGEGWAELRNPKGAHLSQRKLLQWDAVQVSPESGQWAPSFLGASGLEQCFFLLVEGTCCSRCHPCGLVASPLRQLMAPSQEEMSSLSSLGFWRDPVCGLQSGHCCPPPLKSEASRQIYWESGAVGLMGQVTLRRVMNVAHGRKQVSGRKNWLQTLGWCRIPSGPPGLTILGAGQAVH